MEEQRIDSPVDEKCMFQKEEYKTVTKNFNDRMKNETFLS